MNLMIDPQPIVGSWHLTDLPRIRSNGIKCFSTFACGGGSSMGYKLAGFDMLGALEIEERIAGCYRDNLNPKTFYEMDIRDFNRDVEANPEKYEHLIDVDVLDGSPPCSPFSMAGKRDEHWQKEKMFGEGKKLQTLDDLFFDFIKTVDLLKPKVVVAENVMGLIAGKAKGYAKEIHKAFRDIGYDVQIFALNAARMGVPQRRSRIFFLCSRRADKRSKLELNWDEPEITCAEACATTTEQGNEKYWISQNTADLFNNVLPGQSIRHAHIRGHRFNEIRCHANQAAPTIPAMGVIMHWQEPRYLLDDEYRRLQSFPDDYIFNGDNRWVNWVVGMSVPPLMMQRLALEIARQWFGVDYCSDVTTMENLHG